MADKRWAQMRSQYLRQTEDAAPPPVTCEACRRPVQVGNDAFQLEHAEAPGIVLTVCAPCVFGTAKALSSRRGIAYAVASIHAQ